MSALVKAGLGIASVTASLWTLKRLEEWIKGSDIVEGLHLSPEEEARLRALAVEPEVIDAIKALESVSYRLTDISYIVNKLVKVRALGIESIKFVSDRVPNYTSGPGQVVLSKNIEEQTSDILLKIRRGLGVTVYVGCSSDVMSLIPLLFQLASRRLPSVIHVSAGEIGEDMHARTNYNNVLAARQTGVAFLTSHSVQEAHDIALIAHVVSAKFNAPVLHLLDNPYQRGRCRVQTLQDILLNKYYRRSPVVEKKEAVEESDVRSFLQTTYSDYSALPEQVDQVMLDLEDALGHRYRPFEFEGHEDPERLIVCFGSAVPLILAAMSRSPAPVGLVDVRLYRPWSDAHFLQAVLPSVKTVVVIDQAIDEDDAENAGPLFLDVVSALQNAPSRPAVTNYRYIGSSISEVAAASLVDPRGAAPSNLRKEVAPVLVPSGNLSIPTERKRHGEKMYVNVLKQTLGERLKIANVVGTANIWGGEESYAADSDNQQRYDEKTNFGDVEFGYGAFLAMTQRRMQLVSVVSELLNDASLPLNTELRELLTKWHDKREEPVASRTLGEEITAVLRTLTENGRVFEEDDNSTLEVMWRHRTLFAKPSYWLVGSSNWAYDLSYSGVHHVIKSKEKINLLIVETEVYSQTKAEREEKWKKDIGLFAMTYGGVYVASVAAYSSYTQLLRAVVDADAFPGPSIILAYAPDVAGFDPENQMSIVEMLKETKVAVDSGKWPLYRWNPNDREPFTLDSQYLKKQIEEFLRRENQLSMLMREVPAVNDALSGSLGSDLSAAHRVLQDQAEQSYLKLLKGMSKSQPVLIIYGSDGGNAEGVAKRLEAEGNARGLECKAVVMDDCNLQDLVAERNVVAVVSTAGQGEFPSNSKNFWKSLCADSGPGMLTTTRFAVFAMGDSHYWPRPEEAIFFAKPGKDLDKKLAEIGGERLMDYGIGDDQEDDGYETGLAKFEAELWEALGVGNVQGLGKKQQGHDYDAMKIASNYLRGTLEQSLADETTGAIAPDDQLIIKFHGVYQQDDRDLREKRRQEGQEKAFSFMIRICLPGGICSTKQWLLLDEVAEKLSVGTIKLTTRQAFQLHGVLKKNMKATMQGINRAMLDTIAACGDVSRNIMANPNPVGSVEVYEAVHDFTKRLADHLKPRTTAYHEIWLDQKPVAGYVDEEPMYSKVYLPRKFKIVVAVPPHNDVDIFAHCLGFIAIVEDGKLVGFNVTAGGGMGMTHNNKKTYPRLAEIMGFVTTDKAIAVAEQVVTTQRDFGERKNRKHARLKYTIDDRGIDWFRGEVENRCGFKFEPARHYKFTTSADRYGWTQASDGTWNYCMYVEHGRIKDTPTMRLKSAVREIATFHQGDFRLTPNGNLIFGGIKDEEAKVKLVATMDKFKIGNNELTGLRLGSMACAALPYCALAFAESERYLPSLVSKLEKVIDKAGIASETINIRMTGCANGCARPYLGEIGFVGRSPGIYNLYLGAAHNGERLNKLYKEAVNEEQIIQALTPILFSFAKEKQRGEHFGDFVIRKGYVKATIVGRDFHDLS